MKNIPFPVDQTNNVAFDAWANSGKIAIITRHENPYEIFKDMDRVLKPYGLEVIVYFSKSTDYWYSIEKIKPLHEYLLTGKGIK